MTKPQLCDQCGTNPVAYRGRATCYQCVPKARMSQTCDRCRVNRVAYPGRRTCYDCVPRTLDPRLCERCGVKPIAYYGRTTCYDCVPRARKNPSRCKKCGSTDDYYTNGRCRRCHRKAPVIDSCRDCFAWGVTRHRGWRCQACAAWRFRFPNDDECGSCHRRVSINERGYCRLCCRQAHLVGPKHSRIDVVEANRYGQQLFLADLFRQKRIQAPRAIRPRPSRYPVTHEQQVLLVIERDWTAARRSSFGEPPLPDLAEYLDEILVDHADRYGWSKAITINTRSAIRILLVTQQTPGAPIKATHVEALKALSFAGSRTVMTILDLAGMLDDDSTAAIDAWFTRRTAGLPEQMSNELAEWFDALRHGRTSPPRRRPRKDGTVRTYITATLAALNTWAAAGHQSLREISRQDVLDVLPTDGHRRHTTLIALRSLFRFLKARRLVFTNPTARLRGAPQQLNQPLPIDLDPVRQAINSDKPARAALAALIAFHALRPNQVSTILLTDVRDGRLHLPDQTVLLAEPVRTRIAAWLNERIRRWPNTANPYLFVNHHTAIRTTPTHRTWIRNTLGLSAQAIREDRILHEAVATGGDVRRLSDLFGLTVGGAERYVHTDDEPTIEPVRSLRQPGR